MSVENALNGLYEALNADDNNAGVNDAIAAMKAALSEADEKSVEVEPTKLPNNTREGRRMLKSYAKKRGLVVTFPKI